ncbi:MAG: carboxypeptidase regulatory-like domain-containing protein [Vicingaceae bacterium]
MVFNPYYINASSECSKGLCTCCGIPSNSNARIAMMMRFFMGVFTLLIFSEAGSQNYYIIGHIVDYETNRPVPGVTIYMTGKDSVFYIIETDEHGYFRMDNIYQTTYVLQTIKKGYTPTWLHQFDPLCHSGLDLTLELCKGSSYTPRYYGKTKCPYGHGKGKVIPILHGMHGFEDSLKSSKGEVYLGSESFNLCKPAWLCVKDSLRF